VTRGRSRVSSDSSDDDRKRIGEEIASRLRRQGVQLTGQETSDELADLEEAVEEFERAVERAGGDLMVDEPVTGGTPLAPDDSTFVLPARKASESVPAFLKRINEAAAQVGQKGSTK
jgi:sugar phosphate isomerase/epimerase